jgi:hypothetical protein
MVSLVLPDAELQFWEELASTVPEWYAAVKSASEMHLVKSKMYGHTDPYENFYIGAGLTGMSVLEQGEALMAKHQAALSLWRIRYAGPGDPELTSAAADGYIDRAVYAIINLILFRRTYESQLLGTYHGQVTKEGETPDTGRGDHARPREEGGSGTDQRRTGKKVGRAQSARAKGSKKAPAKASPVQARRGSTNRQRQGDGGA